MLERVAYYYHNKLSGASSWYKPAILRKDLRAMSAWTNLTAKEWLDGGTFKSYNQAQMLKTMEFNR